MLLYKQSYVTDFIVLDVTWHVFMHSRSLLLSLSFDEVEVSFMYPAVDPCSGRCINIMDEHMDRHAVWHVQSFLCACAEDLVAAKPGTRGSVVLRQACYEHGIL